MCIIVLHLLLSVQHSAGWSLVLSVLTAIIASPIWSSLVLLMWSLPLSSISCTVLSSSICSPLRSPMSSGPWLPSNLCYRFIDYVICTVYRFMLIASKMVLHLLAVIPIVGRRPKVGRLVHVFASMAVLVHPIASSFTLIYVMLTLSASSRSRYLPLLLCYGMSMAMETKGWHRDRGTEIEMDIDR